MLDLGCGCGAFLSEIARLGTGFGADVSIDAIAQSRRRGLERLCLARAEALPYATGSFHAVAALDVVEHVEADTAVLGEIARVLRPNGAALVHVPAFPFLWSEHDVVAHHHRRYRRADLHTAIARAGLVLERESYVNLAVFPLAAAVRVAKRALGLPRSNRPPALEVYALPGWLNTR